MKKTRGKKPKHSKIITYTRRFVKHVVFCMSTATMHGLIHIIRPKRTILERLFWVGLVAGSITTISLQALKIWDRYRYNPVIITVDEDFSTWHVPFASVIICQIQQNNKAYKFVEKFAPELNVSSEILTSYLDDILFSNYYTYEKLKKYVDGTAVDLVPTNRYLEMMLEAAPTMTPLRAKEDQITHIFGKTSPVHFVLTERGPCDYYHSSISEFFNVTNSNLWNITSTFSATYLNISVSSASLTFSDAMTVPYDLYLEYFNEIIDISSNPALTVGKTQIKEIEYEISIVDSDESLDSMTPSQRHCKFPEEIEKMDHSLVYSYKICRMECRINLCLKFCQCTPLYYRRLSDEPICNMTGLYCLSHFSNILISLVNDSEQLCQCYPSCNTAMIQVHAFSGESWDIRSILKIGFNTFPSVRYLRSQLYTGADVLVQIGGLLGFFLGGSLLSIVEITYFATLRFFWSIFGNKPIGANF